MDLFIQSISDFSLLHLKKKKKHKLLERKGVEGRIRKKGKDTLAPNFKVFVTHVLERDSVP